MSLFGMISKEAKKVVKDAAKVNISIKGPNIAPPSLNVKVNAPVPKVDVKLNSNLPPQGIHVSANMGSMGQLGGEMYKIPETAHAHPVILDYHLNGECKICRMNIGGQAGYRCDGCDIMACFNCSNRIFYGIKHPNCHPQHPLALTSRKVGWKCDLCKNHFKGGASFYCKQCDFDACDKCYLTDRYPQGFIVPPMPTFEPQPGFATQPGYPPQGGYDPNAGYPYMPSYPPQGGFPPSSGYPPQMGYPPQPGPGNYPPPQQDSELINRLNETIRDYEAKLKISETDYLNLKTSSMEERSKLQATIDALNKELAAKDGQYKNIEIQFQTSHQKIQGYEADLNRMRMDLDKLIKERDGLLNKSKADGAEIFRLGEENKNLHMQLTAKINEMQININQINDLTKRLNGIEFQIKAKDDQIMQINGKHEEDRRKMQMHIDSINAQLIEAQNKVKNYDQLYISIKRYEEFINKMKLDIIQFQSSGPAITIIKK